jgi:hypothetical protein
MNNTIVLPYKVGSSSAKLLANTLRCKRMKLSGSTLRDNENTTIINWGNSTSDLKHLPSVNVINKTNAVSVASNKLKFFKEISKSNQETLLPVSIPEWTTSKSQAKRWYAEGNDVVVRHLLQGHSAEGLELVTFSEDVSPTVAIPNALLYTKYMRKRDEYRVHVAKGVPIHVQRKAHEYGSVPANYQIRNHDNGFIYTINDLTPDQSIISEAINAVAAINLDFGAVDVIWNERKKKATVLEVNTACGLEGDSTSTRYVSAFKRMLKGKLPYSWKKPLYEIEEEDQQEDTVEAESNDSSSLVQYLQYCLDNLEPIPNVEYHEDLEYLTEVTFQDNVNTLIEDYINQGGTDNVIHDYHYWLNNQGIVPPYKLYVRHCHEGERSNSYTVFLKPGHMGVVQLPLVFQAHNLIKVNQ